MRIVTIDQDKCKPNKCGHECFKYCPIVKGGKPEIIKIDKVANIDEGLCIGCGICVKVCPFGAISVINLPEAVGEPVHRYGENLFALFGLPTPGESVGILGPNGTGKTTLLKIFSGQLIPNLGKGEGNWESVLKKFSGTEVGAFLSKVSKGELKVSYKPQEIVKIPQVYTGTVKDLLKKVNERDLFDALVDDLNLQTLLERNVGELSGGELQKVAIAATLLKDADLYFFDEPGSFLDIYERLKISQIIRKYSKKLFVVEHDLIMLDYLVEQLHITYGKRGSYGIVSLRKGTRVGINEFLDGFLKSENIRIRNNGLKFIRSAEHSLGAETLVKFKNLSLSLGDFNLKAKEGEIHRQEIVGVLGRNALGKTSFIKALAGVLDLQSGEIKGDVRVSYKPQYIKANEQKVEDLFNALTLSPNINLNRDVIVPLDLIYLMERKANELSGGELQRVAVGLCLAQDADLYLLDEPSAFLDSEQRIRLAKLLRRLIQNTNKSALVVEHDLMFLDYISDRIMVFSGIPGKQGKVQGPMKTSSAMKIFLKDVDITLRRDKETLRPRVNKKGSTKDKEQRAKGEWYEGE